MGEARKRSVPLSTADKVEAAGNSLSESSRYREIVGGLLYLSTHTRPDLAHATGVLSRYMANPTEELWVICKWVVRYVSSTINIV
jgi:ATP-binding cassette subfamily B (MDR/TAP) protein 1